MPHPCHNAYTSILARDVNAHARSTRRTLCAAYHTAYTHLLGAGGKCSALGECGCQRRALGLRVWSQGVVKRFRVSWRVRRTLLNTLRRPPGGSRPNSAGQATRGEQSER